MAFGGRSGIRTHERVAPLTVFKTVAFVRSAILPGALYLRKRPRLGDRGRSVAADLPMLLLGARTLARSDEHW